MMDLQALQAVFDRLPVHEAHTFSSSRNEDMLKDLNIVCPPVSTLS